MNNDQTEAIRHQTRVIAAAALLPYSDELNKARCLKILGDAVGGLV